MSERPEPMSQRCMAGVLWCGSPRDTAGLTVSNNPRGERRERNGSHYGSRSERYSTVLFARIAIIDIELDLSMSRAFWRSTWQCAWAQGGAEVSFEGNQDGPLRREPVRDP